MGDLLRITRPCAGGGIRAGELGRLMPGMASAPCFRPQSYYENAARRGT
ncbi:MAG TPA: hypothetical protein VGG06_32690 [Thermoanaerobaculia bacterium]|jgi:hypothetical protein